jgi:hypothetical protein
MLQRRGCSLMSRTASQKVAIADRAAGRARTARGPVVEDEQPDLAEPLHQPAGADQQMTGDKLAVVVQLDGALGDARLDLLAQQAVRHRVVLAVKQATGTAATTGSMPPTNILNYLIRI